jgi:hypothetical protein
LAYRRRHGSVRLRERQLHEDNDGGRGGCDGARQDLGRRESGDGQRRRAARGDGDPLAESFCPGGALGSPRRCAVFGADGIQDRRCHTVRLQFSPRIKGGRDAAQDSGPEALLRAGGHAVCKQGGGGRQYQTGGGRSQDRRQRSRHQPGRCGSGGCSHGQCRHRRKGHPRQQIPDGVDVVNDHAEHVPALEQPPQGQGPPAQ